MTGPGSEAVSPTVSSPSPPSADLTLIVSAMPEELAPIAVRSGAGRRFKVGTCVARHGRLGDTPVILASTGDGRERAERGIALLLARFPAGRVFIIGVAGGLSPALPPGEILAAAEIREEPGTVLHPDPEWVERAGRLPGITVGTILSADRILSTAASKADARARLPKEAPAAVDLESAAYARAAATAGIPCLVLRAISDAADEDLPFDFNRCLDRSGGVSRLKVMGHALLRPASLGGLWDLRRRVGSCSQRLADAVDALLSGDTPGAAPGGAADRGAA